MKRILLAAAAALICMVQVHAQQIDQLPSIEVRGRSEIKVSPDRLVLSITIDEKDYKGKATLEEKQEELLKVLHKNGIDPDKSLKVGYMGSNIKLGAFRYQLKSLMRANYVLELDSVAGMQEIIEQLGKKEISRVVLVETGYSAKDELELKLATAAVKDARKRAEALAEALEQDLGKALQIYVRPMYSNNPVPKYRSMSFVSKNAEEAMDEAAAPETSKIAVTELEFSVEVTAKFELK